MKNTKHKARLLMLLGLLCILGAGGMAGHILLSEHQADQAAQTVLTELTQQIPHSTPAPTEATLQLVITDQRGTEVDWPMAENNVPMPWPLDEDGVPTATVTDTAGKVFIWQYDVNRPILVTPIEEETLIAPNTSPEASPRPDTLSATASSTSAQASAAAADNVSPTPIAPVTPAASIPTGTPYSALPQTDDILPASTAAPTATLSIPASTWSQDSQGSLLPYVSDGEGQVIPWLTDVAGQAVARDVLLRLWKTLVAQLSINWTELLAQPAFVLNPQMEMPVTTLNGHEYIGILDIPSQSLSLPIMSEWSYPKLKIAPCRYSGSAYSGDLIIAGHNSNGHFSPIKKLGIGDEVRFTDVDGNMFIYSVIGIDVVDANDVPSMLAGSDVWDLSLFTCSHSARKRTTIRCKLETYLLPEAE